MSSTNRTSFEAQLSLLPSMMHWIHNQLLLIENESIEKMRIELAMEEALVNIISYAYDKQGGMVEINFYYNPGSEIRFTIKDQGVPFNPLLEESDLQTDIPLEERKEGGLGIPMIHKIMDVVEYERQADTNVLKLRKRLN